MGYGGARPGAGRKSNAVKLLERKAALEAMAGWLTVPLQNSIWRDLLNDEDPNVRLQAIRYLSDQMYGKAGQSMALTDGEGGPLQFVLTRAGKVRE